MSRNCTIHPTFTCDYINLKPSDGSPFVCSLCRSKQQIPDIEVVKISEILEAHPDTFIRNFPILTDFETLKAVEGITDNVETMQNAIDSYFTHIKETFLSSLEKAKLSLKQKILIISKAYREVLTGVQEARSIQEFKLALYCQDSEKTVKEFIRESYSQAEQNTQLIQKKLSEFKSLTSCLSFSQAKEIEELICGLAQEIDILPQIPSKISSESQECYPERQIKQYQQKQKSLELLIKQLQERLEEKKQSILELEQQQQLLRSQNGQIQLREQHQKDQNYDLLHKQHKQQQISQENNNQNEQNLQQQNEQSQLILNEKQDKILHQSKQAEEQQQKDKILSQQKQQDNNDEKESKHQQQQFSDYHTLHNQLHPMQQYLLGIQYDQYNYQKWLDLSEEQRVNIIQVVKDELKKQEGK